jgi:hypothetical protein
MWEKFWKTIKGKQESERERKKGGGGKTKKKKGKWFVDTGKGFEKRERKNNNKGISSGILLSFRFHFRSKFGRKWIQVQLKNK